MPWTSSPVSPSFPRLRRRQAAQIPRRKAPSTAAKSIPSRRISEPEPLIPCPFSLPLFCAPIETVSWFKLQQFEHCLASRRSPPRGAIPAASTHHHWTQSSTQRTPSSSPRPDAPRRPLHHLREHLQRRRRRLQCRCLAGAARRKPSPTVSLPRSVLVH
jgi:hypothetical protein